MTHRIFVSAGGTGGGIYPALAVIEALRRIAATDQITAVQIDYIGGQGGMEEKLVPHAPTDTLIDGYHTLPGGPLHSVPVLQALSSAAKIAVGIVRGLALIRSLKPRVLFITGGWATLPISAAAWIARVPILVFLPDIEPALTIKGVSRLARTVYASTGASKRYFPASTSVVETGYPLRAEVLNANRAAGLNTLKLSADRPVILVTGGSRGAKSLNQTTSACAAGLITDGAQIVHISGEADHAEALHRAATFPAEIAAHYHLYPYLHNQMGSAYAAADLVISRAGASVIGEYPYFSLPSILVPYPYAWRYQKTNADWLVSQGAALRLDDENLSRDLLPTVRALLNDSTKLTAMRAAASALRHADAADRIARAILNDAIPDNTVR